MTENNKNTVETLKLLGFSKISEITDEMLDKTWYNLNNTVKYIKLLESKFNIKFTSEHFVNLILSEILNTNPLYWQTIYKLFINKTYEEFGLRYEEWIIHNLENALETYNESKGSLNYIRNEARQFMSQMKDRICLYAFVDPRLNIKELFVHKERYYIGYNNKIKYWDNERNISLYRDANDYNIDYIDYHVYTGTMAGKKLKPIATHDDSVNVVEIGRYSYITHQNTEHAKHIDYDKYDFLLRDCELMFTS